jgi:hypothetical protein
MNEPDASMRLPDNGTEIQNAIARAREALAPVRDSLERAGFYAYGTVDAENEWVISADDEAGHVDVRVGADGFQLDLWATYPGLFSEEENEFRRRAMERLARMTVPAVQQGFLAPHQAAWWDETEGGPAARIRYQIPFTATAQTGAFAREHLPELEQLLDFIATQVSS